MRRPAFVLWAPVAAYMAAIFWLSHQPDAAVPGGFSDKTLHGLAYFGLSVLMVRALAGGLPRRIGSRTAAAAVAIAVGYGATDEMHQMFVPGRVADPYDLLADAAGAAIGAAACWAWGIISCSRPHRGPPRDEL